MKTYQVTTAATTYPVSLTEAKSHLKVDTNADDTYIESIIKAATQLSEEYTNRFFIDTVVTQYASDFKEIETLYLILFFINCLINFNIQLLFTRFFHLHNKYFLF